MQLIKFASTVILAAVVFGGSTAVLAQTTSSISQAQFNAETHTSLWSFEDGMDWSTTFSVNGAVSDPSSSPLYFGDASTVWSIAITINSGHVLTTAQTLTDSPVFNWSENSMVASLVSSTTISLAAAYNANNNEGMMISGISINDGIPVSGTITADQSNPFGELTINNSIPITSLDYTLTVNTPDPSDVQAYASSGGPAVSTTIMIPQIASIPEPSTIAMMALGLAGMAVKFGRR